MSIFQTVEQDVSGALKAINTDFLAFLGKVKSGAQIVAAELDAAIHAIAAHVSTIDADMQKIQAWVTEYLPLAQAAGLSTSDAAIINSAVNDAGVLVTGLKAVAASVNAGSGDVTAVVSGISAVAAASKSTSAVVQALAQLPVPSQTQVVSPASPSPTA